ncbi:serine esterase cutinase [Mycobacterium lentiflavum]|uniref:Serine esterase cutinase n=1 Tax=Mycobacterium lentiflavum TaxID=141349 RepID=A0A0E4CPK8_MYCLN|nr:serine esterase cutinase [Mycobacterium lentiflavum]
MCQHEDVNARRFATALGAAAVTTWATLLNAPLVIAPASAAPCPDIEVTFARATNEAPGVGVVGQQFIDALRPQVGGRSLGVYAVNYPASEDFAPSASAGGSDVHAHVQSMVATCPSTKLVLGGNSLGAMAIDEATIARAPIAGLIPDILTADQADHVAALALFGNPSDRYLGAPVSEVSPWYGAKAIDLCAAGDPVCTPGGALALPSHDELFSPVHLSYAQSGMPSQAATFVASHL